MPNRAMLADDTIISVPLSKQAEANLRARAAAAGQDLPTYAAGVLERLSALPAPLRSISGALADEFRASGLSDDELGDLLERAKHESRREKGLGG
jgi:hypothetical protein